MMSVVPQPSTPPPGPGEHTLQVRRTFDAEPASVFEAWTTPAMLERWYALEDSWSTEAELDLRVGGRYRLVLRPPGRDPIVESGRYLEIVPGERLVYTQESDAGSAEGERVVVTVEFLARGDGTEVVVTETGYRQERIRDLHRAGWPHFLERLAAAL